jgi:type IV fimbrial biogenesis protein FimT
VLSSSVRRRLPRRASRRGFTLIELMVVVLIISVIAVLAIPQIVLVMRERRSREAAQQIALLYSNARMRAMGRGSAVMVRYAPATGFSVIESIQGAAAIAQGLGACTTLPGAGCLLNNWNNPVNYREVTSFNPRIRGEYGGTDLAIALANPSGGAVTDMNVCFSPLGRTFASYAATWPATTMAGAATIRVQRGEGLTRTVAILPNGSARLAL